MAPMRVTILDQPARNIGCYEQPEISNNHANPGTSSD
jgi:hypothetical protein